jgi:hypothetical protein
MDVTSLVHLFENLVDHLKSLVIRWEPEPNISGAYTERHIVFEDKQRSESSLFIQHRHADIGLSREDQWH